MLLYWCNYLSFIHQFYVWILRFTNLGCFFNKKLWTFIDSWPTPGVEVLEVNGEGGGVPGFGTDGWMGFCWKGLVFLKKHVVCMCEIFGSENHVPGFFGEMSRRASQDNQVWAHDVESTWSISPCLLFEAWITLGVLVPILLANMCSCFSRLQPKFAGNASIY